MKKKEFDWVKIERIMNRSFRGEHLRDEEQRLLTAAWASEPTKYGEIYRKMKSEEVDRISLRDSK